MLAKTINKTGPGGGFNNLETLEQIIDNKSAVFGLH